MENILSHAKLVVLPSTEKSDGSNLMGTIA